MRKLRTRGHQIEDLSYNYVERQILQAFCVFRRFSTNDYGYDGAITTFSDEGEIEPGILFVQVKSSENLLFSDKNNGYKVPLSKRDLELWLNEPSIVFVVAYDATQDLGFFVDLKSYFRENRLHLREISKTKAIFIKKENTFTPDVVKKYGEIKNDMIWN